jgi:hypothetical protein
VTTTRSFLTIMTVVLLSAVVPAAWAQSEVIVYSEGFENSNGGYTFLESSNPVNWMWGNPSLTTAKGPGSAHTGAKSWGTNMGSAIPRYKDGSIISPAIQLPGVAANQQLRVRFWAFVSLDGMYDRGQFFISKDGSTWTSLMQLYNNMEMSPNTAPSWHKYEFGIDPAFANGAIYLRFRAATPNSVTFYCGGSDDLSGFYFDDVAISLYTFAAGTLTKNLSLRAWEDSSTWASCPWVSPWNGDSFAPDNDIYSVARYAANEYTDYYKLGARLVPNNGIYPLKLQERSQETSYTDFVALMQIDHAPEVAVAADSTGRLNAYVPGELVAPLSALSSQGVPVLSLISVADGDTFAAYSGDSIALDFGPAQVTQSLVLVLRAIGFVPGQGLPQPYTEPPAVIVETPGSGGQWVERGRFLPRLDYSTAAFDLGPFAVAGQSLKVRLRSASHDVKYNGIDYVALYKGNKPAFAVSTVTPSKATANNVDILPVVGSLDAKRYTMTSAGEIYLEFPVLPQPAQTVRDFVLISKGYYEPMLNGTYLIYTFDGTTWVQRDSFNFPGTMSTRQFDLSMFLPDPQGEYKARIWQDYQYEPAGIDQVSMTAGGANAPLNYAWDFRTNSDVFSRLLNADNVQDQWSSCPRNRLVEVRFTPTGPSNIPPATNPVFVTEACSATPVVNWTYRDSGQTPSPQASAEIQVWTGPGHSGSIVWNPPTFYGLSTSAAYAGPSLIMGSTYYLSVRANDGADWGAWSEASFTPLACACGDLNGDGKVDVSDYNIMKAAFGKKAAQPGYSVACDFDKDGIVSLKDYTIWYACYIKYKS